MINWHPRNQKDAFVRMLDIPREKENLLDEMHINFVLYMYHFMSMVARFAETEIKIVIIIILIVFPHVISHANNLYFCRTSDVN